MLSRIKADYDQKYIAETDGLMSRTKSNYNEQILIWYSRGTVVHAVYYQGSKVIMNRNFWPGIIVCGQSFPLEHSNRCFDKDSELPLSKTCINIEAALVFCRLKMKYYKIVRYQYNRQ